MLTPSGVSRKDYTDAIMNGNLQHTRLTAIGQTYGNNEALVFDDEDIEYGGGIALSSYMNGETDLIFGRAVMDELTVHLFRSDKTEDVQWSGEFQWELGVEINGETKWVTVGYYVGRKPERSVTDNVIEFHLKDRMCRFEKPVDDYIKTLTFSAAHPISMAALFQGICSYCGVAYESGDELSATMARTYTSSPFNDNGLTCRDAVALIAEANGCYARIASTGKMKLVWFHDHMNDYSIYRSDEFSIYVGELDTLTNQAMKKKWMDLEGYTWNELQIFLWGELEGEELPFRINGLNVRQMEEDVGVLIPQDAEKNIYLIVDNPFLKTGNSGDVNAYLYPIYARLVGFGTYLPMSVQCKGNWLIEPGDVVQVEIGRQNFGKMPVFTKTLAWNGSAIDTYETTGNLERETVTPANRSKFSGGGRLHEVRVTINENYERIMDQFGNYYTKTETASEVSTAIQNNNGNYYTKTETATQISTAIQSNNGNYYTKTETASQISTAIQSNNGNYYTKTETASQISTAIQSNNGNYYTRTETANQISTYVGNNAYGKVSGITINSSGITMTGSQHITMASGGYVKVQNWTFDSTGLDYASNNLQFYISTDDSMGTLLYCNKSIYLCPQGNSNNGVRFYRANNGYNDYLVMSGDVTDGATPLFSIGWTDSSHQVDQIIAKYIYWVNYIGQLSSRKKKHNIRDMEDFSEKISRLNPVRFIYNDDEEKNEMLGLIYEDTVDVIPEICFERNGQKAIDYVKLVPILLKEVQRLQKEIAVLKGGNR